LSYSLKATWESSCSIYRGAGQEDVKGSQLLQKASGREPCLRSRVYRTFISCSATAEKVACQLDASLKVQEGKGKHAYLSHSRTQERTRDGT
jgi:hypothetical protein